MSFGRRPLPTAPRAERVGDAQGFELMKISVSSTDIGYPMLSHDGGDVRSSNRVPDMCGYSLARSRTASACRSVSIKILNEGAERNASMNCQACENERGWAKAERC